MDTDVGFNWGTHVSLAQDETASGGINDSNSSAPDCESDEEENSAGKSTHKPRKKAAAKRQEAKEGQC